MDSVLSGGKTEFGQGLRTASKWKSLKFVLSVTFRLMKYLWCPKV